MSLRGSSNNSSSPFWSHPGLVTHPARLVSTTRDLCSHLGLPPLRASEVTCIGLCHESGQPPRWGRSEPLCQRGRMPHVATLDRHSAAQDMESISGACRQLCHAPSCPMWTQVEGEKEGLSLGHASRQLVFPHCMDVRIRVSSAFC